jgi:hypothetical protein
MMTELQLNTKNSVQGTLQVFASADKQRKYKNDVHFVHIPNEIIAQWASYQQLRSREWYIKIWSNLELKSLDDFDLTLRKLLNDIGDSIVDVPEILQNKTWVKIMKAAEECLKCIGYNSD